MRTGRRIGSMLPVGLAALFVLLALLLPDEPGRLTPDALVRLPVEAVLAAALVLLVPRRARRPLALLLGAGLALLVVTKLVDLGFGAALARPFDPVLDRSLIGDGYVFVRDGISPVLAPALVLMVLLIIAVVAAASLWSTTTAVDALGRRPLLPLLIMIMVGVPLLAGAPVVRADNLALVGDRIRQLGSSLTDEREFAAASRQDRFSHSDPAQLLTGLQGHDVLLVFVESYGHSALTDPDLAVAIDPVITEGQRRLDRRGFTARSAWLTSSTAGGGSWLAHATLLSGLWVDNQQRYRTLVGGDRLTLTRAFAEAGWRTAGVMPGVESAWSEAGFFGYAEVRGAADLGYAGPRFSWATTPDQFTLAAVERLQRHRSGSPVMAVVPLVSSHAPWSPTPRPVPWGELGDGRVFAPMAAEGFPPEAILTRDPPRVRADYRAAVGYSVGSVLSYLETFGDDDLVVVVVGDHQPSPIVTGPDASRDVPITVVSHDPAVVDRIADWGWDAGVRPSADAPVWRMDAFRDRFLTAFSGSTPGPPARPGR